MKGGRAGNPLHPESFFSELQALIPNISDLRDLARERERVLVSWLAESLMAASALLALSSLCKGGGTVFFFLFCFFCLALELFGILVLGG